jgi:hypothetical protein
MGLGDRLGSIDEGKTASMVLVRANPLDDIRNARKIDGIFLRGKYFNRQDLDNLLLEAKDLAQNASPYGVIVSRATCGILRFVRADIIQ